MSCVPVLIQRAYGVGGDRFSVPTQAGNTVLGVIGAPIGAPSNLFIGHLNSGTSTGDDQGNYYNGGSVLESSPAGLQTDMWYIDTNSIPGKPSCHSTVNFVSLSEAKSWNT